MIIFIAVPLLLSAWNLADRQNAVLQQPIYSMWLDSLQPEGVANGHQAENCRDVAEIVPAPTIPDFAPAPTRKRHAGWTAERQRRFIEHLALTGNVGDACALVGLSSTSFYRLCNRAGADSLVAACNAARILAATRGSAIAWDRAVNGRVERFYKDGELVLERRIPSDYLLTSLLARLDPLTFGSAAAKAHALAHGDPRETARKDLPRLMDSFEDVPEEECPTEKIDYLDHRLGETGSGEPISDQERG